LQHAEELGYLAPHRPAIDSLIATGRAEAGAVTWIFHSGDFTQMLRRASLPAPHAIVYDPYSPATNRDMWTLEHLENLHACLDPARPCLLTNYTRSTAVRVTLLLAGFLVGRGPATGEKLETTVAANALSLLNQPLDHDWLARVPRSSHGAPLRMGESGGSVSEVDLAKLQAHPQFSA
jgi:tRNA U34 5-methylaminomethyl-2-thiouridine-forming methyltransferase MnmC